MIGTEGNPAAGLIALALYILPGLVASFRKVPNVGSVWVIDVLLGWTVIGWIVALAMAVRTVPPKAAPWGMPRRPDRR